MVYVSQKHYYFYGQVYNDLFPNPQAMFYLFYTNVLQ